MNLLRWRPNAPAPDMETIYLLCGLLCDEEVWQGQVAELRNKYDVRVASFQGHDSIGAMAAHVLDSAPERFSLAGHSMGGRVALEVYRRAPRRIERLALLDTGYEPVAPGEGERRAVLVNKALAEGIESIAETWARPMIAPCNQAAVLERVIAMVGRMSGEIYAGQTRALLGRPDATPVLASIACPTLILCGADDAWSPADRHERMQALIPRAALKLIDDCGHMSTMERPMDVLAALLQWMHGTTTTQPEER
jgi:pimeloyl-ACP methyl ester carboxylesterase